MKSFLALLAVLVLSAGGASGQAITGGGAGYTAASTCSQDGSSGAPTGATTLYAARKASWAFPPACSTPDVDYAVGPDDDCASCVSPASASYPAGVAWNAAQNRLDCNGAASGARIHHLDFTKLSGSGGGILIQACDNVIIDNIKIVRSCVNSPQPFILRQTNAATNITVTKVWIDGGSVAGAACGGGGDGEAIYLNGSGSQTVTYSRVINAAEHNVTVACPNSACTTYVRYNSFSATGFSQGAHDNGIQWLGTFAASDVSWNYWFNPQPSIAIEAAANLTIDTTISSTTATIHMDPSITQTSLLEGESIASANLQVGTKLSTLPSPTNPMTVLLTLPATGTASGVAATMPNVYPLGLVNPLRVANQSATAVMRNVVLTGNVLDGDGPIKPGTNAISCGGDGAGFEVDGLVANQNYWLPAGYSGGFYLVAAFCTNTVPSTTNKRLDTGATITFP